MLLHSLGVHNYYRQHRHHCSIIAITITASFENLTKTIAFLCQKYQTPKQNKKKPQPYTCIPNPAYYFRGFTNFLKPCQGLCIKKTCFGLKSSAIVFILTPPSGTETVDGCENNTMFGWRVGKLGPC